VRRFALSSCLLLLAACGKGETPATTDNTAEASASATPTGATIEVRTVTDEKGSRFEPATIRAKPGDVLHFVLVSGVHNVSFPADSNPAGATLPAPTDMLQLPGQTVDLPVTLAAGKYRFQCDPHAALGMVGTLEVE
jgi:plastocyanin